MNLTLLWLTLITSALALFAGIWNLIVSYRKERREEIDFFRKYDSYFEFLSAKIETFTFDDETKSPVPIINLQLKLIGAPVSVQESYYLIELNDLIFSQITFHSTSFYVESENSIALYIHLKEIPLEGSAMDFIIFYGTHADVHSQVVSLGIGKFNRIDPFLGISYRYTKLSQKHFKEKNFLNFGQLINDSV